MGRSEMKKKASYVVTPFHYLEVGHRAALFLILICGVCCGACGLRDVLAGTYLWAWNEGSFHSDLTFGLQGRALGYSWAVTGLFPIRSLFTWGPVRKKMLIGGDLGFNFGLHGNWADLGFSRPLSDG